MSLRITNPNFKVLLFPIGVIIVVLFLFVLVFWSGYPLVSDKLNQLKEVKSSIDELERKLSILKEVGTILEDSEDVSVLVLPEKNPGSLYITQVKSISFANSLNVVSFDLKNTNVSTESSSLVNNVELKVDFASKDFLSVGKFLSLLFNVAPIATIEEVKITESGSDILTTMKAFVYWSPFPVVIAGVTQPVKELAPDQKEVLDKIREFSFPKVSGVPFSEGGGRNNPFFVEELDQLESTASSQER